MVSSLPVSIARVAVPEKAQEKAQEDERVQRLLDAQDKAAQLFDEIERRAMIRPGVGEQALSDEIRDLAAEMFGVTRHWHRRIVRAGENTWLPFKAHPPDRVIADDDIAFLDLGPIFEEWEADFGRTFVLGDDPAKKAVREALPRAWQARGCSPPSSAWPAPRVSSGEARSPAIWWASFRTRRSPAMASSGTSRPARASPCGAPTAAGGAGP